MRIWITSVRQKLNGRNKYGKEKNDKGAGYLTAQEPEGICKWEECGDTEETF